LGNLAAAMSSLDDLDDGTVEGIREKRVQYEALVQGSGYLYGHLLANAWCAAFVWPKRKTPEHPFPITTDMVRKIEQDPFHCPPSILQEIHQLAGQYRFFHWHMELPTVFGPTGGQPTGNRPTAKQGMTSPVGCMANSCFPSSGFDVILGNPAGSG